MEERGVLREQFVHPGDVQAFDAAGGEAVEAVQTEAPEQLCEEQDPGEAEDVRQRAAEAEIGVVGDTADELGDDQRGDVVDADVAQCGQQHRARGQPLAPGEFPAVVAQREEDGAGAFGAARRGIVHLL